MSRNPEKTLQTKQELTQAFWDLYATTPISRITVANVCERAGYHRGTFYLHFHDVYQVLEEVEQALLDEMANCVESCMQRLTLDARKLARISALKDVVVFYERNKRFIGVLLGPQGDAAFAARVKDVLKPLWRRYVIGKDDPDQASWQENGQADVQGLTLNCKPNPKQRETRCGQSQRIDFILEFTLTGSLAMISKWLQDPQGLSAYELGHLVYDTAIKNVAFLTK